MGRRSAFLVSMIAATSLSRAGTFFDDFSFGLRSAYYTVTTTGPGTFSLDATHGDVRMARTNPGADPGFTNESVAFNLATFGAPLAGDFSTSVDFRNAVAPGPTLDQVELHTDYEDGSRFYDVYSNEGGLNGNHALHVFDDAVHSFLPTTGDSGTFTIARVGSTVRGYFGGALIFSRTQTSKLTNVSFIVQNFNGNDPVSATYDNFTFTAQAVPEPASLAVLGLGSTALLRQRRRA